MVGMTGDPSILSLDDLTLFGGSPVSVNSRAFRSGQLGSCEWSTLRWITYLIHDLLAASWRLHARPTHPREEA